MRVAFDHNVPRQLRRILRGHFVQTASESDWVLLSNGQVLRKAEETGFNVLMTCDSDFLQYRNVERQIAIVYLTANHWPSLERSQGLIRGAVDRATKGSFEQVVIERNLARDV